MNATIADRKSGVPYSPVVWKGMPPRMRVLHITTRQRTGGWLAEAFAADSASQVLMEEAVGTAAGLARLRDEAFDAVLVSHEPGDLDALDLIEGYRAGGSEEPIVVLGTQSEQEMAVFCYEVGADGYVCVHTATTRSLIWIVARAVQRHQLVRENQRFAQAEQARLLRENDEGQRMLQEQRAILEEPASCDPAGASGEPLPLPPELIAHYRELLRIYVIMGSGNLGVELRRLAEVLVAAGLTARQTMQLHLRVVEEMIHGLGARSTRHVMNRADLLALEVMIHVSEGYRHRYQERVQPPMQRRLPGLD
jgi:DNA-binding NarL/FixJ family response regulator